MSGSTTTSDGNTIDIPGLMTRLRANESQVSASQNDLNAALAAGRGAAGAASGGANLEAQGQIAVNTVVQTAKIKQQTDDAANAALLGLTPGAPSDLVVATIQNYQANQADLLEREKMIADKQGQDFLDDPMQWLTNQFSLPYDIAAYNLKLSAQDRNVAFLKGLSQEFDDQAKVNATVDVATGQSLLDGLNKIALGKAQAASAGSQMALANLGISVANMRVAMTDKVFDNYLQASNVVGREQARVMEQRRLQLAENADVRADAELKLRTQQSDAMADERDRKEGARRELQATLDRATSLIGQGHVDVDAYLLDPNKQKALAPFMLQAQMQSNAEPGTLVLGSTPAESLKLVQGIPLPVGNELTRRWMETTTNTLVTGDKEMWKSRGADVQQGMINNQLRAKSDEERNNIPVTGGLYSPPPLKSILTMRSLVAEDGKSYRFDLLNDVKALAVANPTANTDPQLFFSAAMARIQSGAATPDQMALEIANIYRAIGWDNSLLRGYDKFNMKMLAADNGGFKQQVNLTGIMGGSTVVDLMNATAVRAALTRLQVRRQMDIMGNINQSAPLLER